MKVGCTVFTQRHQLAIDDKRPYGDLQECVGDRRIAIGEIGSTTGIDPYALRLLMELDAVSVELDLMDPVRPLGGRGLRGGEARLDETHYLFFPPRMTRSGDLGRSGGRIGGSRSGKKAPQPSGQRAEYCQCGQSPASWRISS